jgi:FkbM family methyltransferase
MSDQTYIDNIKSQVDSGMYDKLFADRRDLVFLDIGANVGIVSIYAVPYCKRIVAVEPCIETFEQLRKNTKDYQIISNDRHALAPSDGNVGFYVNDLNFTASSTVNTYGKYEPNYVMGATLSTLLRVWELRHVDVCKIDAEGAEGESLNLHQLEQCSDKIKTYYIETHNCPKTSWEHKLGTIVGNLARCGYSTISIDGMAITATRS